MKKTELSYLKRAVHQSLIQIYDHTDLPLVLGLHLGQEAGLVLLRTHTHTPLAQSELCLEHDES